ncbi:hypothetical protein BDZ89DRAFT_1014738 [Hymenopellis radicata]|nr:hypothetical protein BDZ89DRAFT_1014738 [Hymenopellis radicata]
MDTSYVEFEDTSRRRFLSHFKTNKSPSSKSRQISSRSVESFGHVYASDKDLPPVPKIPSAWTQFVPSRSNTSDSVATSSSSPGAIIESPRSFSSTAATSPGIPRKPVGLADEYLHAAPTTQDIPPPQPTADAAIRVSTVLDEHVAEQVMTRGLPPTSTSDRAQMAQKLDVMIYGATKNLAHAQTLVEGVMASAVWQAGKSVAGSLLQPAKDLVPILDIVAVYIPPIMVAKSIFSVFVKLETDKHDNDAKVDVVLLTMTDFWTALFDLKIIFESADAFKASLEKFLADVCKTMNDFGNFRDVYYKHGHIARTIRSGTYKQKLVEFAQAFVNHKSELQLLLTQTSALTIKKVDLKVDDLSSKMDVLLRFIQQQSPLEQSVSKKIARYGGEERALNDPRALAEIAHGDFHLTLTPQQQQQIMHVLHSDMETLLKSNAAMFQLKIEETQRAIQKAVERSTETILLHLDAGPHSMIRDEDIQALWKGTKWRLSCKTRHFVDAVHHYFSHKFAEHRHASGTPHPDQWTLKFLRKVIFQPTIGDAIDEDGSGYVSVYEVNHFFKFCPEGWTPTQWLCYSAAGWYENNVYYRNKCMELLTAIQHSTKRLLPVNRKHLKSSGYLKTSCLQGVFLIVDSLNTETSRYRGEDLRDEYDALNPYRLQILDEDVKRIRGRLEQTGYQLDSPEEVAAIISTSRIELRILCLVYLLLERHAHILQLAENLILSEREFLLMTWSMNNTVAAFGLRYMSLAEGWRQQRRDAVLQVQCFASGIFESWHAQWGFDTQGVVSESPLGDTTYEWKHDTEARSDGANKSRDPADFLAFPLPKQPSAEELKRMRRAVLNPLRIGGVKKPSSSQRRNSKRRAVQVSHPVGPRAQGSWAFRRRMHQDRGCRSTPHYIRQLARYSSSLSSKDKTTRSSSRLIATRLSKRWRSQTCGIERPRSSR